MTDRDATQSSNVVSLQNLTVNFEESSSILQRFFSEPDTVHAVDDVSLDIYENDVVALVGESGCGKTTLGKAAIGVQQPTNGSVTYRDQNIWTAEENQGSTIPDKEIRQALQIIHQDPGSSLNPNRTVQSTLEVPLKKSQPGRDSEARLDQIHGMLERVGMTPGKDYAARYPHQLSGGEKQRVALIRSLFMNPDLVLADEAVSALDVSLRIEMMDLMLELQDLFNTSYLFISHDFANARYIASKADGRIGVMYMGELVEIGPAEEVINNPKHPYTKALMWSTADLEMETETGEPPLRSIDIPDPVNPPSGCRFHTRCPEAKELCREQSPSLNVCSQDRDSNHTSACFRECSKDHAYWESEPLSE